MLFKQFENKPHCMFENYNKSVDEFFSQLESQKLDMKALQQVILYSRNVIPACKNNYHEIYCPGFFNSLYQSFNRTKYEDQCHTIVYIKYCKSIFFRNNFGKYLLMDDHVHAMGTIYTYILKEKVCYKENIII